MSAPSADAAMSPLEDTMVPAQTTSDDVSPASEHERHTDSQLCIPITATSRPPTAPVTLTSSLTHFSLLILPLSLSLAVLTADMFNLDFIHLVSLHSRSPPAALTLPSDDLLKSDALRWTFLQSAYLLPLMLMAGPVLILQLVLLVGRLSSARLVEGVSWMLTATVGVVGTMTLLNAFVGESVVGVVLSRMVAGTVGAGALGLIVLLVELRGGGREFETVTFAVIYGLGSAIASCDGLVGYCLARLLQRHGVAFHDTAGGFRGLFLVEGALFLALCPVIGILLMLAGWAGRKGELTAGDAPQALSTQPDVEQKADIQTPDPLNLVTPTDSKDSRATAPSVNSKSSDAVTPPIDTSSPSDDQPSKTEKPLLTPIRRLSSYCTSPLTTISILRRNDPSPSTTPFRSLSQLRTGIGRFVSTLLRRIMIFVYGNLGVDHYAFDLISLGTSSRETFICGVLIVSNTVIIQLAVVSLIAPLKAPDAAQVAAVGWKMVPTLPGLPTLAGGVSGAVSAVGWSLLARRRGEKGWTRKRWWVPALLTACLVVTLIGLGLAVVASIMVPGGTGGIWIMYLATIVTYAGSTPQLPLALQQMYAVLDAELGRNTPSHEAAPSVQAIRWERVGAIISTLTTIAGSELLTAWVFLMPDAAQKVFLFTSAGLAIGGCVWLMIRHTREVRVEESAMAFSVGS